MAGMALAHLPAKAPAQSSFQVAPTPNEYVNNGLQAVSASSPRDIWAVGSSIIHFDGAKWTAFPVAGNTNETCVSGVCTTTSSVLSGVADISPTDAWAIGTQTTLTVTENPLSFNSSTQPVIDRWDGSQWSIFPGPSFASGDTPSLTAMTAVSANDIWAVGSLLTDGGNLLNFLFEHWDGTSWAATSILTDDAFLLAVSADSANDVWAVGFQGPENDTSQTLVMHFDGTKWNKVASPSVGMGASQLNAVLALAPNDVWAVGFSTPVAPPKEAATLTLTEHWDGTSWTVVKSPNVGPNSVFQSNVLYGMTAASPTDIWAFGSSFLANGSGNQRTLLMNWNGAAWSMAASPNPNKGAFLDDILFAGVAPAAGDLWIVGSEDDAVTGGGFETLAIHGSGSN
ncbi:MAG: hypothetical protein ABSG65_00185 [Bryobacteraceae bacterium]|jgi:hypothetical protein